MKKSPNRVLECLEALLDIYQPYPARIKLEEYYEKTLKDKKVNIDHYNWYSTYKHRQEDAK